MLIHRIFRALITKNPYFRTSNFVYPKTEKYENADKTDLSLYVNRYMIGYTTVCLINILLTLNKYSLIMKIKTTLLAALSCLLFATSCQKSDDKKKDLYATNKAGERLVEKIDETIIEPHDTSFYSYYCEYNSDGAFKTIIETSIDADNWEGEQRIYSFKKQNNTLYLRDSSHEIYETSFELNKNGQIVLDRGWEGKDNYRLSYDPSGKYLHNVFKDDELLWTFEWKDDNIYNEEVTYIDQAHHSNIDWGAFFQSWRLHDWHLVVNEFLIELPSLGNWWAFSDGYFGNKCQGLPMEDYYNIYTYDYTEDGFVSAIYISGKSGERIKELHISYLKK